MDQPQFDTSKLAEDFSKSGVKVEGPWENDRNRCFRPLFKAMIMEATGAAEVFIGHHIIYEVEDPSAGAIPQEIPSADTLILDHVIMERLFGYNYLDVISVLSRQPVERRDQLLADLYYSRENWLMKAN